MTEGTPPTDAELQAAVVIDPERIIPELVEDNPKIPVKAILASVVGVASYIAGLGLHLPKWLEAIIGAVVMFGTVYYAKNPKRVVQGQLVKAKVDKALRERQATRIAEDRERREREHRPGRHAKD